jgi:hypothetical protein
VLREQLCLLPDDVPPVGVVNELLEFHGGDGNRTHKDGNCNVIYGSRRARTPCRTLILLSAGRGTECANLCSLSELRTERRPSPPVYGPNAGSEAGRRHRRWPPHGALDHLHVNMSTGGGLDRSETVGQATKAGGPDPYLYAEHPLRADQASV